MDTWYVIFGIMGLGMTSAVHPCPLTTHIAIVSFLGSLSQERSRYWYIGSFILSYCLTLFLITQLIISSASGVASIARFLQSMSVVFLGPFLMIAGMFQLGWLPWQKSNSFQFWNKLKSDRPRLSVVIGLGSLLAVAFCPATAVLFFTVVIPLIITSELHYVGPCAFALGALLPLIAVAFFLGAGVGLLDRAQSRGRFWGRIFSRIAGGVLMLLGFYVTLRDIYGY